MENVKTFTYLGVDLQANGRMKTAVSSRIAKTNRALFLIRQALKTTGNVNTSLALSIFDKQIMPILTYGCPLWGLPNTTNYILMTGTDQPNMGRDIINTVTSKIVKTTWIRNTSSINNPKRLLLNLDNIDDKDLIFRNRHILPPGVDIHDVDIDHDKQDYEKIHTKFCKYVLNIPKQAGNDASRGELGRFPLSTKIWKHAIKYWLRLEKESENIFVNNAYRCAKMENHPWIQKVRNLLSRFGLGHIWANPNQYSSSHIGNLFERRLKDIYIQTWNAKQSNSSRFKLQHSLTNEYGLSIYLKNITCLENRNTITRLRLDMNMLNECMGRQQRSPTRLCPHCPTKTESVEHFLLNCSKYDLERTYFVRELAKVHRYFSSWSPSRQLHLLLNCGDINSLQVVSSFILKIYKLRRAYVPI